MKKISYIFLGVLVGVVLSFSAVAFAATGLVGKKIQSEADVLLDGKSIGAAIIVDGKSYAPVRAVGEAAGLGVGYKSGKVILTSPKKESGQSGGASVVSEEIAALDLQIRQLSAQMIEVQNEALSKLSEGQRVLNTDPQRAAELEKEALKLVDDYKAMEVQLNALVQQKEALQQ